MTILAGQCFGNDKISSALNSINITLITTADQCVTLAQALITVTRGIYLKTGCIQDADCNVNKGKCVTYTCQCLMGWAGEFCQVDSLQLTNSQTIFDATLNKLNSLLIA